jgi:predicted protein tyrosine phosphatase
MLKTPITKTMKRIWKHIINGMRHNKQKLKKNTLLRMKTKKVRAIKNPQSNQFSNQRTLKINSKKTTPLLKFQKKFLMKLTTTG